MERQILRISLLSFLMALYVSLSFAQTKTADSASMRLVSVNFYKAVGQASRLYNGHEYEGYDPRIKNNALFPYDAKTWAIGEVTYDDVTYTGVSMMYDIYKDAVVVQLYNHFSMFTLLSERVNNFSFSDHRFIRIDATQIADNKAGLSTGFYEQLYTGKIEVLAKRRKTIQNSSNTAATIETSFSSTDDYYLKKGDMYFKIGGKGSVLNILKDKKSELQNYLKQENMRYGDNPELAIVKMVSYYDKITN